VSRPLISGREIVTHRLAGVIPDDHDLPFVIPADGRFVP
jgi:hypothetical protein